MFNIQNCTEYVEHASESFICKTCKICKIRNKYGKSKFVCAPPLHMHIPIFPYAQMQKMKTKMQNMHI